MKKKQSSDIRLSSRKKKSSSHIIGFALSMLYENGVANLSMEDFWHISMNALMALLNSDKGLLLLFDNSNNGYKAKSSRGFRNNAIFSKKFISWENIAALMGDSPVPLILGGVRDVEVLRKIYPQLIKPKSFIAVPLYFDGNKSSKSGVFFLFDKKKKNSIFKNDITTFSSEDVLICVKFLKHIIKFEEGISLTSHLKEGILFTNELLVSFLESKIPYFANHSRRVFNYCKIISHIMGIGDREQLLLAASLHDIGMFGVNTEILNKPEMLSKLEMREVQSHVVKGVGYLKNVSLPWNIKKIIYHHHERYDGRGYPDHLKEEEIPLESRIIAVADCYDSLRSLRPYRKALDTKRAILYMKQLAGNQLDPDITDIFLKIAAKIPNTMM